MAKFTLTIETKITGALAIGYEVSEEFAQDIFAMELATAAKVSERDPDTGVTTERDRKLGECLENDANAIWANVVRRTNDHKIAKAQKQAADAVDTTVDVKVSKS